MRTCLSDPIPWIIGVNRLTLIHALVCVRTAHWLWMGQISGVRAREEHRSCHVLPACLPCLACLSPTPPTLSTLPTFLPLVVVVLCPARRPTALAAYQASRALALFGVAISDPNRFWIGIPPCISRHLPRLGENTWILQAMGGGLCLAGGLAFCSFFS